MRRFARRRVIGGVEGWLDVLRERDLDGPVFVFGGLSGFGWVCERLIAGRFRGGVKAQPRLTTHARHSCEGRNPVTLLLASGLARYRDRAAYAAGVSTFCRRPSHFSFAGPRTRRSACERRSRPEGRRAGCPESKKSNPKKMAFRAPVAPCGIRALAASVFGIGRSIRPAVRLHRNAPSRRGALHSVEYKR